MTVNECYFILFFSILNGHGVASIVYFFIKLLCILSLQRATPNMEVLFAYYYYYLVCFCLLEQGLTL